MNATPRLSESLVLTRQAIRIEKVPIWFPCGPGDEFRDLFVSMQLFPCRYPACPDRRAPLSPRKALLSLEKHRMPVNLPEHAVKACEEDCKITSRGDT